MRVQMWERETPVAVKVKYDSQREDKEMLREAVAAREKRQTAAIVASADPGAAVAAMPQVKEPQAAPILHISCDDARNTWWGRYLTGSLVTGRHNPVTATSASTPSSAQDGSEEPQASQESQESQESHDALSETRRLHFDDERDEMLKASADAEGDPSSAAATDAEAGAEADALDQNWRLSDNPPRSADEYTGIMMLESIPRATPATIQFRDDQRRLHRATHERKWEQAETLAMAGSNCSEETRQSSKS